MRRAHQIAAIALLAIAVFLGYHAAQLRYYSSLGPGPGFFPVWLCALLAVLSLVVLVQAVRRPAEATSERFLPDRRGALRVTVVVASLLAVALAMPVAGFRLTMLAFFLVLLTLLDRRRPLRIVLLSLVGSFGVYFVFVRYLSQPLPVGVLGL